jgi:hypothetical protein
MPGHLGNGTCQFHTGGSRTNDDKGQQRLPLRWIRFLFGLLIGGEEALPNLQRALQTVHARRVWSPVVMAKVMVVGTGGDDEGVVGQFPTTVDHQPVLDVNSSHLAHERADVLGLAENLTQRRGNVSR